MKCYYFISFFKMSRKQPSSQIKPLKTEIKAQVDNITVYLLDYNSTKNERKNELKNVIICKYEIITQLLEKMVKIAIPDFQPSSQESSPEETTPEKE